MYVVSNSICCGSFHDHGIKRGKMIYYKLVRVVALGTIDVLFIDMRSMLAGNITVILCPVSMTCRAAIIYIDCPSVPIGSGSTPVATNIGAGAIVIIHRCTTICAVYGRK
jgi:hypothetical protein